MQILTALGYSKRLLLLEYGVFTDFDAKQAILGKIKKIRKEKNFQIRSIHLPKIKCLQVLLRSEIVVSNRTVFFTPCITCLLLVKHSADMRLLISRFRIPYA